MTEKDKYYHVWYKITGEYQGTHDQWDIERFRYKDKDNHIIEEVSQEDIPKMPSQKPKAGWWICELHGDLYICNVADGEYPLNSGVQRDIYKWKAYKFIRYLGETLEEALGMEYDDEPNQGENEKGSKDIIKPGYWYLCVCKHNPATPSYFVIRQVRKNCERVYDENGVERSPINNYIYLKCLGTLEEILKGE